jgi:hypothetical protein
MRLRSARPAQSGLAVIGCKPTRISPTGVKLRIRLFVSAPPSAVQAKAPRQPASFAFIGFNPRLRIASGMPTRHPTLCHRYPDDGGPAHDL